MWQEWHDCQPRSPDLTSMSSRRRQVRTDRHRRPARRRLRGHLRPDSEGRGAGGRARVEPAPTSWWSARRRSPAPMLEAGSLSLDRPRRRRLQHDRRGRRVHAAASTCRTARARTPIAVAELAFAPDARARPPHPRQRRASCAPGNWNKKEYSKARGLFGRTLGLLGFGNIGQEVARRAHAFGMPIVVWSRRFATDAAAAARSDRAELRHRSVADTARRRSPSVPTS